MKPPPPDPLAMQARSIAALCADILDSETGRRFPRVDALRATHKQMRGKA